MQFTSFLYVALGSMTLVSAAPQQQQPPPPPTTFPANIQHSIVTLQGYIQTVIKDFAQNTPRQTLSTDYSSTGRSLDFFLRNTFLPGGPSTCPQASQPLPPQAKDKNQAIAYLQQAQLALIAVSQDAVNNNFNQGKFDICQTVRQYGGAAMSY